MKRDRTMSCAPLWLASLLLLPAVALSSGAVAQQNQPAGEAQPRESRFNRELTVSPAVADEPGEGGRRDSFAFSQDALAMVHRDAAPLYLQAFANFRGHDAEREAQFTALMETPVSEIDAAAARQLLEQYGELIYLLTEPAVRRERADWGAPVEEKGIEALLPSLAPARQLARIWGEEARVLAREGKFDESADVLRRIFILSLHVGNGEQPVLVEGLVGVGIAALGVDKAAQIAQLPGAPNRYWALTTLPKPMFNMPRWFRTERTFVLSSLPTLREPEFMTEQRLQETFEQLARLDQLPPIPGSEGARNMQEVAEALRPFAERFFRDRGHTQEQVDQMGLYPMLGRYLVREYEETFDELARLIYLPYPDAQPRLAELGARYGEPEQENAREVERLDLLARILLGRMDQLVAAPWRLERQIAALRIVEAVRDHAARNDGRPPASLDQLRLPVPRDPMTGEMFDYSAEADTFTLTARQYDETDIHSGFVWRVTVRE